MQSVKLEKEKKQPKKDKKPTARPGKRLSSVQAAIRGNSGRLMHHSARYVFIIEWEEDTIYVLQETYLLLA